MIYNLYKTRPNWDQRWCEEQDIENLGPVVVVDEVVQVQQVEFVPFFLIRILSWTTHHPNISNHEADEAHLKSNPNSTERSLNKSTEDFSHFGETIRSPELEGKV